MKIFGVSLLTIAIVIAVAVIVQKYGSSIPVLNMIPQG